MKTYTHVGWMAVASFNAYWHGDGDRRPKKAHACNDSGDGRHFRALCGEQLRREDDYFGEATGHVVPAAGNRVTCKRCRKLIG